MDDTVEGVVVAINAEHWRYAIHTDYGYVVADAVTGRQLERGEAIEGDLRIHGDVTVRIPGIGERLTLRIEAIDASIEAVRSLLASR